MLVLLLTMLERLGILVTIAFLLTRLKFFKDMIHRGELNRRQIFAATLFFSLFGIIGTYSGLTYSTESLEFDFWGIDLANNEAIANSRVVGIIIAGMLGGYRLGIGAGVIAGIHRMTLGGFTSVACGLAAIAAGIVGGIVYKKNKHVSLKSAFFVGAVAETIQMLIILMISRPFEQAFALVKVIGFPMILANGIGTALFLLIIRNVMNEEEKAGAIQAQKALRIADQTLAYLRKGMSAASAAEVCRILYNEVRVSAVSMTNRKNILAHVGEGDDHHRPNAVIQTDITKQVLRDGKMKVVDNQNIHCAHPDCPLNAAVVVPLKQRERTVGTLKFYFRSSKEITNFDKELISGLGVLLSNQLEIAEADKAFQLAKEAEVKALQAQINPHFLFNSLNTIVSLIRINPAQARKLLISLSHFLRQNLTSTTQKWTTLAEELKHVKAYLAIEEARFVDKLKVEYHIDERALSLNVPPLTLQPLVENTIKHGFKDKESDWVIEIHITRLLNETEIVIKDNGKGMEQERLKQAGRKVLESREGTGIGLYNVNRRLIMAIGPESGLQIESRLNEGTTVSFNIYHEGE
ncbi:MAG TPA: sensor histidine kinase [Chondromyces sp.]|nr:sensor histidine kinase [Chondromyces sp.]